MPGQMRGILDVDLTSSAYYRLGVGENCVYMFEMSMYFLFASASHFEHH